MKKPNIVFILSDDQGAWAMRCAGNSDIITPNLDRLANDGIRFDNFFCASPVCSPARASIVTGEMPSCHGVQDWLNGGSMNTANHPYMKDHPHFKKSDTAIEYLAGHPSYIAELAKNGYRCALSGKWHLGNSEQPKEGFEKWFTISGGGCNCYYRPDTFENGHFNDEHRYVTDVFTDRALEFIDEFSQDEQRPFYLSVHYTAPHTPWTAENHPQKFIDMYKDCEFNATPVNPIHKNQITSCAIGDTPEKRRECLTGYYAAISAMDYNIGRIMDKVEQLGQTDNTIFIFTADNGMNLGQHGVWGKGNGTYPPNMYDSSVKVPCIIKSPFIKEKGKVCDEMLSHYDLFPTILDVANCNYTNKQYQAGRSFAGIINEDKTFEKSDCIAIGDEYGIVRMLRNSDYKLICNYRDNVKEFYDLNNDPNEEVNQISNEKYFDVIAKMQKQLDTFFEKYTTEENDGRKNPVTGRGQHKLCTEKDAFTQDIVYYYKDLH